MALFSRRHVLGLGVGALSAARLRQASAEPGAAHGMSAFGDLKYPADFHHFEYVNIDAPKGGSFQPFRLDPLSISRFSPSIR